MSEEERKRRVACIRGELPLGEEWSNDTVRFILEELDRVTAEKRLGWERHAEKDRAYQTALDERDAALEQVRVLKERGNELWDALDRIRQFRHAEACDRRDGCACWELELHVLLPVLRNEAATAKGEKP